MSGGNVTHDKFCEGTDLGSGWICICDVIAQVRADERHQGSLLTLEPGKTYVLEVPANTNPLEMATLRNRAAEIAPECKFIVLAGATIARATTRGGEQA